MPGLSRDATIKAIASAIAAEMVEDAVMDISLEAHRQAFRAKNVCEICKTRCREAHGTLQATTSLTAGSSSNVSGSSQTLVPPTTAPSRPGSPSLQAGSKPNSNLNGNGNNVSASGVSTPNGNGNRSDIFFDCLNCSRSIASSRYAPHLSQCLGHTRRAGARNATQATVAKTKLGDSVSRSNSPAVGLITDDNASTSTTPSIAISSAPRPKGRPPKNPKETTPKSHKKKAPTNTPELNANNKRTLSPRTTPTKKSKKAKHSASTPNISQVGSKGLPVPAAPASVGSVQSNNPRIPSRLRASSASSPVEPSPVSPSGSQYSHDGGTITPSRSTSTSSLGGKLAIANPPTGAKTVPGKSAPAPFVPKPVPVHNDTDYDGIDQDDLVDTQSSGDDSDDD